MCGIAGAVFSRPADDRHPTKVVSAMVDALAHRGPDGRGVVTCHAQTVENASPHIVLGHTRLAILDLSDRAAQPMQLAEAPIWITFNGEIYNFRQVRSDLERRGRRFRSDSDTEVVLQGYAEWGVAVVDHLQGMFALAIWDERAQDLLLVRDRLGIKPLYIFQDSSCVLFASEIRALLASGIVPRRLNRSAIDQYLTYQTVVPPDTLVEGVRMIAPGHMVNVHSGHVTDRCYWDLLDNRSKQAGQANKLDAQEAVGQLLDESAALHLVSDVPVGIFLSGGIDSSAIVALTQKIGHVPHTFSVALPGNHHDEAAFARSVAKQFGCVHTEIPVSASELCALAPDALARVDHPSGDGVNTFVISKAVRSTGIKVALSGLGGDELFGGYPSFSRLDRMARYTGAWRRSPRPIRQAAAATVRALGRSSVSSDKAAALLESDGSVPQAFPVMRQVFSAADRAALLGDEPFETSRASGDPYVRLLDGAIERHADAEVMSLVSYAEARTYMHDVLLRDSDQMSMAHGLELRVPLLDHRLAEYVMGLPDDVKRPEDVPKQLLIESLRPALPLECVHRRKQGFVLPFDAWMKGELRAFCEHHLGGDGLSARGVVRPTAVQTLWQAYLRGDRSTSWSRPWTLVALNAWLEQNGVTV